MAALPEPSESLEGIYAQGRIALTRPPCWPDGSRVVFRVEKVESPSSTEQNGATGRIERVIIAGFGPSGRWVAEIFQRHAIEFVIVELNEQTVARQRKLGVQAIAGNISEPEVLREAGIERASALLLTIPDERAVIEATRVARAMNPSLYIVARTLHTSAGMAARQAGADEVIKDEQAVASRFSELLTRKLGAFPS